MVSNTGRLFDCTAQREVAGPAAEAGSTAPLRKLDGEEWAAPLLQVMVAGFFGRYNPEVHRVVLAGVEGQVHVQLHVGNVRLVARHALGRLGWQRKEHPQQHDDQLPVALLRPG